MIVLAIPTANPKTQHIDPQTHEGVSSFCVGHRGSVSTKHHVHESHMFFLVADLTLLRTKGKGARTHTPRPKIGICFHLWFDKDTIKVTWVLQIWTARWIARPCQHHRSYWQHLDPMLIRFEIPRANLNFCICTMCLNCPSCGNPEIHLSSLEI